MCNYSSAKEALRQSTISAATGARGFPDICPRPSEAWPRAESAASVVEELQEEGKLQQLSSAPEQVQAGLPAVSWPQTQCLSHFTAPLKGPYLDFSLGFHPQPSSCKEMPENLSMVTFCLKKKRKREKENLILVLYVH